jgi:hypothetical protein
MALATVTPTLICGPTFDSKTISVWGQFTFGGSDFYETGGIPAGLVKFANALTIDTASGQFLQCEIWGEDTVFTASFEQGGYFYKYNYPADTIQIFTPAGVELTNSQLLPAAILNDVVMFHATWIRL